MADAVFLSASVPDPKRSPAYAATADTVAITAAVSAVIYVTLGRRMLIWGGHPAITPMIWVIAQDIGVDYARWVRLYQSRHFQDEFPEDNARFSNVVYTDDIQHNREKSLIEMRTRMFSDNEFHSAVFIGGMEGVIEEYELFRRFQPNSTVVPVASTGGATLDVASMNNSHLGDLVDDLDYIALFHRHLNISVHEMRFQTPEKQPKATAARLWNLSSKQVGFEIGESPQAEQKMSDSSWSRLLGTAAAESRESRRVEQAASESRESSQTEEAASESFESRQTDYDL